MLALLLACTPTPKTETPTTPSDSAPVVTDTGEPPVDSPPADTADTAPADVLVFYVDPTGDDAGPGSRTAPWASLAGAQQNLRALRASGALDRPVEVELAAGTWALTEPWTFAPEDSGTEDAPVTWRAPEGEEVLLSGGLALSGWTVDGSEWVVTLPEGTPNPAHLWVAGERRPRAQEPDDGWYYAAATPTDLYGSLSYNSGEVDPSYDLSAAFVHTIHDAWGAWESSWLPVASDDSASQTLVFAGSSIWGQYAGNRWRLVNVPEALDSEGEWFYDADTRELRYRPVSGEDPATLAAVVPVLDALLLLEGDSASDAPVSHLRFEGLGFAYTDWEPDADGYAGTQAAYAEGAAIEVIGGRELEFERITLEHTGAHGVWLREGTRDTTLSQSELSDLGAGAVKLGTTSEADDSGSNRVENCFLHHGGRTLPAGQGVWIGQSSHNVVTHNEIADFYYSGVQVGWYWGYSSSTAEDNEISYNHIHTIGQAMMSDLGGVYTLGVSPGTRVVHNVIHDVSSYNYGGWGLYTDEGSSFVTMSHNLVYNASSESFHQHYGEANVITNNILAYADGAQVRRSRAESHVSFYFYNNIVFFDNGSPLYEGSYGDWTPGDYEMDYNLWYDPTACSLDWAGYDWEDWQALGNDASSLVADPLFADPGNLDFTLDAASPAFDLGFEPLDPSEAGLYGEADWTSRPEAYGWTSTTHAEPETGGLSDDFESSAVGDPPAGATVWGDTSTAWIRVTDAEAHGGGQSLEFQDQAGLSASYAPHMWYDVSMCGALTATFAVKIGPGAVFYHEWRDWPSSASSYLAGPSVYVDSAGVLYASWSPIGAVPVGEWLELEIHYTVGATTWTLDVTDASGATTAYAGLSASPLGELNWVGFVANGDTEATLWLDDLSLE